MQWHLRILTLFILSLCIMLGFMMSQSNSATAKLAIAVKQDEQSTPSNFKQLSSGYFYNCAVTQTDSVKCWGNNQNGELGNGTKDITERAINVVGLTDTISMVAAGNTHTCVVTDQGSVKCWGQNGSGQLGDGTITEHLIPTDVLELPIDISIVSIGAGHTCALSKPGKIQCWGDNLWGQIGDGTTVNRLTPVEVSGLGEDIKAIATGYWHTCALTNAGSVKCWGWNLYGQLGDGTTVTKFTPVNVVGLGEGVQAITANGYHTCALTASNKVKCWGSNSNGELGNGSLIDQFIPVDVIGMDATISKVIAGYFHTCAISTTYKVYCWGANETRQLGGSVTDQSERPMEVDNLPEVTVELSAGWGHTCALSESGNIYCWGSNNLGQLGINVHGQHLAPGSINTINSESKKISIGASHGCSLTQTGLIKCWGSNFFGQLGIGSRINQANPNAVVGINSATFVATGWNHTCALLPSNQIKCWGNNHSGQLGDGTTINRLAPTSVLNIDEQIVSLSAGQDHTCAYTANQNILCWGDNGYGQLGDNTTTNRSIPTAVSSVAGEAQAIAAGAFHTCIVTTSGGVKCWGKNDWGQLGDGSTENKLVPTDVYGLNSGVISITLGGSHTCALKITNDLVCWGANYSGQLGTNTTVSATTPVKVSNLPGVIADISAGEFHTCLTDIDRLLYCWGDNRDGQLGDNSQNNRHTPSFINTSGNLVTWVSAGSLHTCVQTIDQHVKCWGDNFYGQLGDGSAWSNVPIGIQFNCYALELFHSGSGDNPTAIPASSENCSRGTYTSGEIIILEASPSIGWTVKAWSGTDNDSSILISNTLVIATTAHVVSVTYEKSTPTFTPTFTPTLTKTPTPTPTVSPSGIGDAFENDDACPTARTITTNSSIQTHTFHKPGDADWLRIDATLNKSYRIDVTIPDGSTADVDLTLYNSCDSVPADQWNASFTPSVRLEFTSTVTGAIYLRLSNYDATVAGANVKYEVSIRQLTAETTNRALIIVAGRLRGADRLQSNIHNVTQRVYTLFQRNDYTDDNIYYLATDSRLAGYDAAANKANLKAVITQWAKEKLPANGVLTLYLIDHGSPELFYLDDVSGQRLTPDELNDWLTQLEDAVSGLKINVIIEACESGSFINLPGSISKPGRVIVTSTNADYDAKASKDGAYFSDHLLTWLHQGYNLSASFLEASIVAKRVFALQTAWLDANGNGIPNELADAALAAQRSFAYEGTLGTDDWPPYIFSVEGPQAVNNASGQISVDVRDNLKVRTVWAVVYPPDYTPPAAQDELQAESLPTILLSATNNGDLYAGTYPGFTQSGVYRIVIHAEDNDGLVARPVEIEVNVGGKVFLPLVTR